MIPPFSIYVNYYHEFLFKIDFLINKDENFFQTHDPLDKIKLDYENLLKQLCLSNTPIYHLLIHAAGNSQRCFSTTGRNSTIYSLGGKKIPKNHPHIFPFSLMCPSFIGMTDIMGFKSE